MQSTDIPSIMFSFWLLHTRYIYGAVFLDLANYKAFDTVDHTILCSKLRCYCFRELLMPCNMTISQIGNKLCLIVICLIGAMCASGIYIIGPFLFALYINDLPSVVNYSTLDLYADDAELHYSKSS